MIARVFGVFARFGHATVSRRPPQNAIRRSGERPMAEADGGFALPDSACDATCTSLATWKNIRPRRRAYTPRHPHRVSRGDAPTWPRARRACPTECLWHRQFVQARRAANRGPDAARIVVIDGATPDAGLAATHAIGVCGARRNLISSGTTGAAAARAAAARIAELGWHLQIYVIPICSPNCFRRWRGARSPL